MNELLTRAAHALSVPLGDSTLEIGAPWALLLGALPLLVWALLPAHRQRKPALRVPFFTAMAASLGLCLMKVSIMPLTWVISPTR